MKCSVAPSDELSVGRRNFVRLLPFSANSRLISFTSSASSFPLCFKGVAFSQCRRVSSVTSLLLLCSILALAHPQAGNDDPTQARIEGTVASAANGQLLPRARIYLRRAAQKDGYVTWINADDQGHFLFKSVEAGPYEILAEKPGFYTDPHKTPDPVLNVASGDHIQGVLIRLLPLAVITGRVGNEHDDPVQDAQLRLLAKEYLRGRESLTPVAFATTDDRGEYRIFGVRPGNYYLAVQYDVKTIRKDPFPGVQYRNAPPETTYPPLFYPLTSDLRQAQRVSVAAGAELHINFSLLSASGVAIEGKVVNGITGEPVKNPSMTAYWGDRITGITRKVDVSATGEFKLDGIEPGPYTLIASTSQDGANYSDFQVVEVGGGGLKNVQLALMPDFDLRGQVQLENWQESAPQSVSVEFMPVERNSGTSAFRASAALHAGRPGVGEKSVASFIAKLHPGDRYRVTIPTLPQDYYVKSVLVDGQEVSTSEVAIYAKNSQVVLVASPAGGHIEGSVRNSKGQPVAGQVLLAPDAYRVSADLIRSVHSDANGRFILRGVAPGSYKLYAWEDLDLNEILGQPELLRNFESDCQLVHVDENGIYNPELKAIVGR